MNTLGAFSKACQIHPGRHISDICTAPSCDKRVLCVECRKAHSHLHSTYLEPLLDFLSLDLEKETKIASETASQCENVIEGLVLQLDTALDKARQDFESHLTKIRQDIINVIYTSETQHLIDIQSLKEKIFTLRDHCFGKTQQDSETLSALRDQYIETCLELQRRPNDILKQKEIIEKSLNISQRDIENLCEKIKSSIQNYKASVLKIPTIANAYRSSSPCKYHSTQSHMHSTLEDFSKTPSFSKPRSDDSIIELETTESTPMNKTSSQASFFLPNYMSLASPISETKIKHVRSLSGSRYSFAPSQTPQKIKLTLIDSHSRKSSVSKNSKSPSQGWKVK
jgi:hypothetical protein